MAGGDTGALGGEAAQTYCKASDRTDIGERFFLDAKSSDGVYLRVANVLDGSLDLATITEIELPTEDISRYELRVGDVLMTEGGDFDKLGTRVCMGGGRLRVAFTRITSLPFVQFPISSVTLASSVYPEIRPREELLHQHLTADDQSGYYKQHKADEFYYSPAASPRTGRYCHAPE